MREILFRGKDFLGKWVQGDYVHYNLSSGKTIAIIMVWGKRSDEVAPKTVGQYIGLTDKNGKKIFEGDIVEYKEEYGQITYSESEAMFMVKFDTWCTDFDHIYGSDLEVVGNIIDNPELLY